MLCSPIWGHWMIFKDISTCFTIFHGIISCNILEFSWTSNACFRYFAECWLSQKAVLRKGSKEKQLSRQRCHGVAAPRKQYFSWRNHRKIHLKYLRLLYFSNSETLKKNSFIFFEPLNQAQVEVLRQEATLCDLGGAAAGMLQKDSAQTLFAGPVYRAAGQSKSQPGDLVRLKSINLVWCFAIAMLQFSCRTVEHPQMML